MSRSEILPMTPAWGDVQIGDQIAGPERNLDWRDVVLGISGSQDWNKVHFDREYATSSGHRDVFFNTGWTGAMLSSVLTDWCGAEGWLRRLEFQMRRMICPGDVVLAQAKVTGKRVEDEANLVELEVWLETDREGVTTVGQAVVSLPG